MSSANLKAALVSTAERTAPAPAVANPFMELLQRPGGFDPAAWHVMQERDNALIRDEILHGAASDAFVYSFTIQGKLVTGVSVVGARELASQYKGIKSRIVATIEKRGALFIFRTFQPLSIETRTLHDLEGETDFYECVMEVEDIKAGNSIQVRKKETKTESKRDGGTFDRPHYDVIAESKAFRNGVLSLLPQSVIRDFKIRCLNSGKTSAEATMDQRRAAATTFASKHGIGLARDAVNDLSFAELDGLGAAASAGGVDAFLAAAVALRIVTNVTGEVPPPPPTAAAAAPARAKPGPKPKVQEQQGDAAAAAPAAAPAAAAEPAAAPAVAPQGSTTSGSASDSKTYAQFAEKISRATSSEAAALELDEARSVLPDGMVTDLGKHYQRVWHPGGA